MRRKEKPLDINRPGFGDLHLTQKDKHKYISWLMDGLRMYDMIEKKRPKK